MLLSGHISLNPGPTDMDVIIIIIIIVITIIIITIIIITITNLFSADLIITFTKQWKANSRQQQV